MPKQVIVSRLNDLRHDCMLLQCGFISVSEGKRADTLRNASRSQGRAVAHKVGTRRGQKDIKPSKPASLGTQDVQSESQHAISFLFFFLEV